MRAAYIEQTGDPDVIKVGELPRPEPGPGQVLVRVHAAAINPIDLYIRSGLVAMPMSFPYVLLCDLAGTVEKLGPQSTRFQVGDRVWGSNQGLLGRPGVASEFAAVDEAWLYPTPALLPDTDAAAMALVGITAHLGLFQFGQLKAGEIVYVPGGSGGVGSMVVQMAKAAGARVATAAGSPEKLDLCRRLGADLALNYKTDDIPGRLREFSPEGIDVWYETYREPNLEVSIPLLRKNGRMILMAGRAAKPVTPARRVLPQELRHLRVCDVQRLAGSAAPMCRGHHPMDRGRPAQAARRPDLSPGGCRRSRTLPRREQPEGRGLLERKSGDHDRVTVVPGP